MTDAHLRQLFPRHLSQVHFVAVETGGTGRGIPDLNGCFNGIEFWIELKRARYWRIDISAEQCAWAERRLRAGGRVFVAVRRQSERVDELYLYHGAVARQLRTDRLDAVPCLGTWPGGPKRWNWTQILSVLTTGSLGVVDLGPMPENATYVSQ